MLSKNEIVEWLAAYDLQKYPVTVYHELVVEQRPCAGRIETLGAWKTGCLKAGGQGRGYVDQNGTTYSFTARWNPNSPVGYSTWQEISKNENDIKEKIPKNYPQTKPAILAELESRKGFGFIWALFVLHCFFPETYPLFDQHVYRAYRYIVSKGSECTLAPPLDWGVYARPGSVLSRQRNIVEHVVYSFTRKKVENKELSTSLSRMLRITAQ
jgi:hypothetical protein